MAEKMLVTQALENQNYHRRSRLMVKAHDKDREMEVQILSFSPMVVWSRLRRPQHFCFCVVLLLNNER